MNRKTLALVMLVITLALMPPVAMGAEGTPDDASYGANTVYYNGNYYPTLAQALTAVYTSSPAGVAELHCKPGADVGTLTHGHVADDIIIYGNGATVSGGEGDLEIDTYRYDRTTGRQSDSGTFLDREITVRVYDLNGIAAWGQRNTNHTVNLYFENCKNMDRIYFTNNANKEGRLNITLSGCSFDANQGSNANTTFYTNSPGDILISDTSFTEIAVGLNINHKSAGVQNITLENCTFTDCALSDSTQAASTKTYGAPVRIVAQPGATTHLTVKGAQFHYSAGKQNCGNGDILVGDGRYDAPANQGTVTLQMTDTEADVMVQEAQYYTDAAGNATDAQKARLTAASRNDTLVANTDTHFVLDRHDQIKLVGEKQATCTAEGYTGDKVCSLCGILLEKGKSIPKTEHDFQNGVCTMCGMAQPSDPAVPPRTGEGNQRTLWLALLLASGICLAAAAFSGRKGRRQS